MDKTFKQKLEILPIKNIEHPVGNTKYYAAVHVKSLIAQADEEISTLKKQLVAKEKQVMELKEADKVQGKEIVQLKSQLQQQSLPVVPEDVDEAIKYLKKHNTSTLSDLDDILTVKGFRWLNDFQFKDTRFGVGGLNNKLFILSHLAITGYQVEKPQLFYLREKNTGYYLRKTGNGVYGITPHYSNDYSEKYMTYKFTQQEIDSMETGSYEQIEVTE